MCWGRAEECGSVHCQTGASLCSPDCHGNLAVCERGLDWNAACMVVRYCISISLAVFFFFFLASVVFLWLWARQVSVFFSRPQNHNKNYSCTKGRKFISNCVFIQPGLQNTLTSVPFCCSKIMAKNKMTKHFQLKQKGTWILTWAKESVSCWNCAGPRSLECKTSSYQLK